MPASFIRFNCGTKFLVPLSNRGSSNMPNTPLWKATAGGLSFLWAAMKSRDRVGKQLAALAGPTSNCWLPGPICVETWPSWSTKSTGMTNSMPLARPSVNIFLACSMRLRGMK